MSPGPKPWATLAAAFTLCLAGAAAAQERAEVEAREVILRQLAAFRAGDYRTAYSFASREIQGLFDPAAFERMVRGGYPQIARSTDAWVTETNLAENGRLYVWLRIRGADGVFVRALYEMVWDSSRWRINGVVTRPDSGTI